MNCTPIVRHVTNNWRCSFYMSKFNVEEKVEAVIRYQRGSEGLKCIAESIGVHHTILVTWIKQYELHGEKAFEKRYTSYTLQYKLDVLNYMSNNGTSIRETAAIFNIPAPSTLVQWKRLLETQGIDALKPKKKGRPSMKKDNQKKSKKQSKKQLPAEGSVEALKAELEQLRMENEYLKKLNALVQNKEKSPKKTK
jgi:transposase